MTSLTTPIQMVDLKTQYQAIRHEVDSAILQILENTNYINGQPVQAFAQHLSEYLGGTHVIPCANGTDALQIALMGLDLEPGDEVITSPFTFIATAEVISLLRLKPVFVDVDPQTFNIDVKKIEAAIRTRTRVILPVHLYGQCADMEPIMALSDRHGLTIVEDNAQAIGAEYTFSAGQKAYAGTIGRIGCTSFYPSKNLGAYGDGGAIMTRDAELADRLKMICNHGSRKRYYHDVVGVNSRLDTIQAAILDIKLRRLEDYNAGRRQAATWYDELLSGIDGLHTPFRATNSTHVFHQYTLRITSGRDELQQFLTAAGIPTMIYYPVPLHLQPAYADLGYQVGDCPVAEQLAAEVLSLPMHPELTYEQVAYIASQIRSFFTR